MSNVTELADLCKKSVVRVFGKLIIDSNVELQAVEVFISYLVILSLTDESTCFRLSVLNESEFF